MGGAEEGHHTAFFDPLEKHTLQVNMPFFLSIHFHLLGKKSQNFFHFHLPFSYVFLLHLFFLALRLWRMRGGETTCRVSRATPCPTLSPAATSRRCQRSAASPAARWHRLVEQTSGASSLTPCSSSFFSLSLSSLCQVTEEEENQSIQWNILQALRMRYKYMERVCQCPPFCVA